MMKKAERFFNNFVAAGLVFAVSILMACGIGKQFNSNGSNSTAAGSNNANAASVETKNTDTSPVTITISDLFTESDAGTANSMRQKYSGRPMTVSGGVLYEFQADKLTVGKGQNPEFGLSETTPQYFVTCKGTFTNDSGRDETRTVINLKLGKAEALTVKGVFKEAGSYNNKRWVILDECAKVKS